jgi:hypothetical protein
MTCNFWRERPIDPPAKFEYEWHLQRSCTEYQLAHARVKQLQQFDQSGKQLGGEDGQLLDALQVLHYELSAVSSEGEVHVTGMSTTLKKMLLVRSHLQQHQFTIHHDELFSCKQAISQGGDRTQKEREREITEQENTGGSDGSAILARGRGRGKVAPVLHQPIHDRLEGH